jgi:Bacterial PH domain
MEPGEQTFRSKVDTWLTLTVAGGLGAMWLAPVRRIWAGRPIDALDVVFPLLATAFIVWVFRATYYVITADALIVRAGPIRRTVPLHAVQRLRATHNPLSSPALSLDRIEVTYGSRKILVSPEDKRGFVSAVRKRAPAVVLEGLSGI